MPRSRKLMLLLAVAAAASGLARPIMAGDTPASKPVTPSSVKAPASLQYAGDMEGVDKFFSQDDANTMIQRIHDSGLNAVRIYLHWNGQAEPPSSDTNAVCYAAHAAEQASLKAVILDPVPAQGNWPVTANDFKNFNATIGSYDRTLLGSAGSCIAHPSPLQIFYMIGNEPNVHTFCDGSNSLNPPGGLLDEHSVCAQREALLLHSSYAFIQGEKQMYRSQMIAGDLKMIGGGLSSNDAPFDFLIKFAQARKALGYTTCDMDFFGYHPYPSGMENGPFFGLNQVPKVIAMLKSMKCPVPLMFTEFGFKMYDMLQPVNRCYADVSPTNFEVRLSQYNQLMHAAVAKALSLGAVGIFNMLMVDESLPGGWTSGWYDCLGNPKPFHNQIRQLFQNALGLSQRQTESTP